MKDTIELLERIGQDAALRHASASDLASALTALEGSEGLRQAAMSGDRSHLVAELGPRETQVPQVPTHIAPPSEEDDESDHTQEDGGDDTNPEP